MSLIPVETALAQILEGVHVLEAESAALSAASNRVLAADIAALRTQPPFDASAMDGYAVRAADLAQAADKAVTLTMIGEVPAGHLYDGTVGPGETVRIFTGAPVPEGADAILIQENVEARGNLITTRDSVKKGQFVRRRGMDFSEGEVLISSGALLSPRHLALAASMNHPRLDVVRRPRVGILATGDELVSAGTKPAPGQIIASNNVGLMAYVANIGAQPVDLGIAKDRRESLDMAMQNAKNQNLDILVTIGGASVGDHDLVMPALEKAGMELGFWRIAMRPGKPLMFGSMGTMKALGLPGNPVSAMVCAHVFLRPLILTMLGRDPHDKGRRAVLDEDLPENDQRQDYLRAKMSETGEGVLHARAYSRQDSSMLAILSKADCLIVRAPHAPAAKAGAEVTVFPLDGV
ncbi:MAG: molybdopterin molybdotransferase MoeA [Fimbriimonadaceae bacterium]|nr:molybdopterin molybdotransferase MoeA [Alphaproteobacteria bacterium]